MDSAASAHVTLTGALERLVPTLPPETVPALIGELARLQALLWTRLPETSRRSAGRTAGDGTGAAQNPDPEWLSREIVTVRYGLSKRWLADHRRQLRLRGIVSKPSRKTTLYHARRLARFLEERSRP
jgi:hypothetical protein